MRCKFWIFILFLFAKMNVFSQEKYVQHIVAKGETVSKIAQQYNQLLGFKLTSKASDCFSNWELKKGDYLIQKERIIKLIG